ncbi:MAG: peptidyl-prolyl cis-trans isomerase [Verrucomicrobiae bacterium]|nr:peptidyl-prolyl cis-trans isomerase [Verrucomicrobiae bacterium]
MITHFQRVIHRHGRWIFGILLGIIIVAFVLWDYAGVQHRTGPHAAAASRLYGRRISPRDLDVAMRLTLLNLLMMSGREVRMNDRARALVEEQTLQRLALVEKARRMGLAVSDAEVLETARQWFSKDGQFNPSAYAQFVSEVLAPRRLSEGDFEEMARETLLLRKLFALVGSSAKVTDGEAVAFTKENLERISAVVCRFDAAEFLAESKPTEAQVADFYAKHPDLFRTPERVRAAYVLFPIEPEKIAPTDAELAEVYEASRAVLTTPDGRVRPMSEVADALRIQVKRRKAREAAAKRATELTVKLVPEPGKEPPSFEALVRAEGLVLKETGFMTPQELPSGIKAPEFAAAAHALGPENSISDPVPLGETAFAVIKFLERQPSVLPSLENVRDAVRGACAAELAVTRAREVGARKRAELQAALDEGKPFLATTAALGLKPIPLPVFSALETPPRDRGEALVRRAAILLPAGGVGDFIPSSTGGFFVHVLSRQPVKSDEVANHLAEMKQGLLQMRQQQIVADFQQATLREAFGEAFVGGRKTAEVEESEE